MGKAPSTQVYLLQLPPRPPHWSHQLRVNWEPLPPLPPGAAPSVGMQV